MTKDRRDGRGRLSSIDLLPEEAEEEIIWAVEQLRERAQPQTAILEEFNARLADRGIGSVSKSAFSRWSMRKAASFRRLDEVRVITGDIAAALGTDGADQVTVAIGELIKVAIFEQLEGATPSSKALMEMARALGSAVAAQKSSADHRRKLEEREAVQKEEVLERVETHAREAGLDADRIAQIRREVLGVRS